MTEFVVVGWWAVSCLSYAELDMLSARPANLPTPPSEVSNLKTPSRRQTSSLMTEVPHAF
ncbi:hypothetical protein J6590_080075 [Homalodisca vitripennis]|nr:hypothetical protein J6590_096883 [Homalodisca vitripennis]KAG8319965.1 hypothetical protein J6590_080075 [Homalodisca vitripennis]